jgi:acetyl esterase/lipase
LPLGILALCLPGLAAAADAKPTFADVSYGPHKQQALDFWQAQTDKPAPLVVFIHGGGFKGGDKVKIQGSPVIGRCLDRGVHFASINYRFRTELPIQDVLRDCARAIQFLRFKADDWKIDKTRVAAYGGSAGAGASLWLAFHDDLADPKGSDPVLRESSRLTAAGSMAGQFGYDILQWEEVLGKEAMRFYPREEWAAFYGLKKPEDLESPEGKRIRADVDMRGLLTKDDPPVFLTTGSPDGEPKHRGEANHHPSHMRAIKKRCDEVGVPAVLVLPKIDKPVRPEEGSVIDFLLKHLVAKRD